jgi:Domain of unknown function (DUF4265)
MRQDSEATTDVIRVNAPVDDPDVPVWTEVLHAAPDPADPDQAVLVNVPFLVDGLNFGDLVRLGPEDDRGVRPILEVVISSGCVHALVAAGESAAELVAELEELLPAYALRIEGAHGDLLSMSIHPDLDPDAVLSVTADFLEAAGDFDPDLEEGPAIGPVCESELGVLAWPIAGV